jgi:LysR family transcriptional regulator, carnitine catabolism transcriptional activator
MNQMNLSTRQLRAFVALAHERNFTRAAAACSLSQPAFSALIRQLEELVGTRLFDRSTRHVELTAEGAEFHTGADRVLEEIEAALAAVRERVDRRRGRVSIALLPSLAADWLPRVLADFRAAHPGIDTHVADVLSEPCIDLVRSGHADFALAAVRANTPELRAEPFCSDDFFLVCPKDHPAAKLRAPKPKDLAAWPFIHLSRTSSVRQYIDAATHPQTLRSVLEVDQLATVSGMVRAGLGISIVPALALYQFRSDGLATRPLRWNGLTRRIYLLRRRDRGLSQAAQALHEWVLARRP